MSTIVLPREVPVERANPFAKMLLAMRRHWLLFGLVTLAGGAAGFGVGKFLPVKYEATSVLLIGGPRAQIREIDNLVSSIGPGESLNAIANEVELLTSRNLARRVIDDLKLDLDPEFNPQLKAEPNGLQEVVARVKGMFSVALVQATELLGLSQLRTEAPAISGRDPIEDVIDQFITRLKATPRGRSNVIDVSFRAKDPVVAADVANTLASAYLDDRQATRTSAARDAGQWLRGRLEELRADLQRREAAVEQYRKKTGLVAGARASIASERISFLSEKLIQSRAAASQADARAREAQLALRSAGTRSIQELSDSSTMRDMRAQESVLRSELEDVAQQFGARHPKRLDLERRLKGVRDGIAAETSRIVSAIVAESEIQRTQVQEFERELTKLRSEMDKESEAQATLRVLEREAEAARELFQETSGRANSAGPAAEMKASDARLISNAAVPGAPATPPPALIGILGLVAGSFGGLAAALRRDMRDRRFRGSQEAEAQLRLPVLGVLPMLSSLSHVDLRTRPEDHVAIYPDGPFAEAVRAVRTRTLSSLSNIPSPIIAITSAVQGEGKSTVSISLARSAAASGRRVLLIDADLRLGRLHDALGLPIEPGLTDYLAGTVAPEKILRAEEYSGLMCITRGRDRAASGDLLSVARIRQLIERLRPVVDLVVIDLPPILPVADVFSVVPVADLSILVVDWARMRPEFIDVAVNRLVEATQGRPAGVIVNSVDLNRRPYGSFPELEVYKDGGYGGYAYRTAPAKRAAEGGKAADSD